MGWTAITTDTSWQELAIASEIAQAYNWRVAAAPESLELDEIDPNENMTVRDFVRAVQDGIEAMAPYFCDPELDLSEVEAQASATELNYADAQALFDAAGLTGAGGWRRIAEGNDAPDPWTSYGASGWEYGKIGDKDLAGPWLFKDLQLALAKLYRRLGTVDALTEAMEASDNEENRDDPPVWPSVSPDAPAYASISSWANDGEYFVFAADSVTMRQISVIARYAEYSGAGLINGNASLKNVAIWVWVSGNSYAGNPDTDFGTGLTLDRFNKAAEKTGVTDVTITARTLPEVTSWASLVGSVSMPGSGESTIYQMSAGFPLVDIVYRWAR